MLQRFKKTAIGTFLVIAVMSTVAFSSDFFEIAKQIDIYTTLFKELNMYYVDEINPAELTDKAIKNMLISLDPYTQFYDQQGVEDARISATGEYGGIGMRSRYKDNILTILSIYKDGPAHKAGLIVGDQIIQIDDIVVKEFKDKSVVNLIKGTPNTSIDLKIIRNKETKTLTVNRQKIAINPVPFFQMMDKKVGYIAFVKFNRRASFEVKKAYNSLKSQGMEQLILDMRHNPGGLLGESVAICNMFLPKDQVIVTTRGKMKKWSDTYRTKNEPIDLEIPIVILIDERSASASEIVSGALQDYDRAVIMGQRSFGKGLVQRYRKLSYGTQMKVTISKYYTPSGRCIQELDYANRAKDGTVPKFSDGIVNSFKTSNGRKVYDGGGVLPDVLLKKTATTSATKALYRSEAFFNYGTQYYFENPKITTATNFTLSDQDFSNLMDYLKNNNTLYSTKTERHFKKSMEIASKEGLSNIQLKYDDLLANIQEEKRHALATNKTEIINKLTENIVRRYYFNEGVYQQKAAHDPVILEAIKVLGDANRYAEILN
ncbi:MAG: S41 family peptidase [Flavobacteriaceae bacterium]|nr:S41 family peptidase [Flavobacteriaceae bacterium]